MGLLLTIRYYHQRFMRRAISTLSWLILLRDASRERIDAARVPIDEPVRARMEQLEPNIAARAATLYAQELNYALRVAGVAA